MLHSQFSTNLVGVIGYEPLARLHPPALPVVFPENKKRRNFTACQEQLKNISTGMQSYIEEMGNLKGVHNQDDICHHLIPGAESPKDCVGEVKNRVNNVCESGTLKVTVLDDKRYEIKATAQDRDRTTICVTEAGVDPEKYLEEAEGCKHKKQEK